MRRVYMLLGVFLFLSSAGSGFAVETYNSVYLEGIAPITIDGDLSDWDFVTAEPAQLENEVAFWRPPLLDTKMPQSPADLSGSFQCFYDAHNLYVAIRVNDDKLVFGQETFGFTYNDDCVEIIFDSSDMNDFYKSEFDENIGQIRVSADRTGKTFLEGRAMYLPGPWYPYMWEALGVKAALLQNEQGYTVEVAIPARILRWSGFEPNRRIGMNVKIVEDDDGGDYDAALTWAEFPRERYDAIFNHVYFCEPVTLSGAGQYDDGATSVDESKEIVAVVGTTEQAQTYENIVSVLRTNSRKDFAAAEKMLNSWNNKLWARFMLGDVQFDSGDYTGSAQTFSELASESPDRNVSRWALYKAGIAYTKAGDTMKALDAYGTVLSLAVENHSSLEFILDWEIFKDIAEIIKNEDEDSPVTIKKDAIIGQFVDSYIEKMDERPEDSSYHFRLARLGLLSRRINMLHN